ncbi:MAG: Ig-like domain-containing protein [Geobacteraceae bacterium]|nr:Ig-like domain-containing protein [Geobacteraceae bacterium]
MQVLHFPTHKPGRLIRVARHALLTGMILCQLLISVCRGEGDLSSGALSTLILYDDRSFGITDSTLRPKVDPVPGGLVATAAWYDWGMKLTWTVSANDDGTYTYHYYYGPGWYPANNGTGGGGSGTGNPYVTNKQVTAWDLQIGSSMTLADIIDPVWNVYQFNGARVGSGNATSWTRYNPSTGAVAASGAAEMLMVSDLTGETGFTDPATSEERYITNTLFHGLQWLNPTSGGNFVFSNCVNFDLTFKSSSPPGWGNFFTNSTRTGSNNNYSDVVAYNSSATGYDSTALDIPVTFNNTVSTPGTPIPSSAVAIGLPSAAITTVGPISYTVTYNDSNLSVITLSSADITLNSTGTATGTVSVSGTTGNTRTVTISNIAGDGTLGISLAAGTASDGATYHAPVAGPSTTFIVDNTPPTVLSVTPADASTDVDDKTMLTATFSESVNLAGTSFTVQGPDGAIAGSVEYNSLLHSAAFFPSGGLSLYTTYTATVSGARDLAGNVLATPMTWSFTTVPPIIGDLNESGDINILDVQIALRIAVGLAAPTPRQLMFGDVGPLARQPDGTLLRQPDGRIDISDAVALLLKVVGLISW